MSLRRLAAVAFLVTCAVDVALVVTEAPLWVFYAVGGALAAFGAIAAVASS